MEITVKSIYSLVKAYKRKYPFTIVFRLRAHSKILKKHLNPDECIKYVFPAQKGPSSWDFVSTYIICVTNKRILLARKRLFFGYMFIAITPDMFNDLSVRTGILWGKVEIDTIKEYIILSNIQKSALPEIETSITEYVMREKKKYGAKPNGTCCD